MPRGHYPRKKKAKKNTKPVKKARKNKEDIGESEITIYRYPGVKIKDNIGTGELKDSLSKVFSELIGSMEEGTEFPITGARVKAKVENGKIQLFIGNVKVYTKKN